MVKRLFIITAISCMVLLTACGKVTKEDIGADLNDISYSEQASYSDAEKPVNERVPDTVSYEVKSSGAVSRIAAKVVSEGYGEVATYSATKQQKDEEYMKDFAKSFFDDGVYESIKPYRLCSLEELEAEKQYWLEKKLLEEEKGIYNYANDYWLDMVEYLASGFNKSEYVQYPADRIFYEYEMAEGKDGTAVHREEMRLRGQLDNRTWELRLDSEVEDEMVGVCIDVPIEVGRIADVDEHFFENTCEYEDAKKQADDMAKRLGMNNMGIVYEVQNSVEAGDGEDNKSYYYDGYTFLYAPEIANVRVLGGKLIGTAHVEGNDFEAKQPYLQITVTKDGVVSFCLSSQYVDLKELAHDSVTIPFDKVCELAYSFIEKNMQQYSITYNVEAIRFGYIAVTYDGEEYAYVPAWRFFDENQSCLFSVCALDGTIIMSGMGSCWFCGDIFVPAVY